MLSIHMIIFMANMKSVKLNKSLIGLTINTNG